MRQLLQPQLQLQLWIDPRRCLRSLAMQCAFNCTHSHIIGRVCDCDCDCVLCQLSWEWQMATAKAVEALEALKQSRQQQLPAVYRRKCVN